jgi:hypothetical protein
MRFRQSNWAALTDQTPTQVPNPVLTGIRDAMLYALGEFSPVNHFLLDMEITFAEDIDELWKLRRELFEALKSSKGERVATDRLHAITQKFVGLHPEAKVSHKLRPSATGDKSRDNFTASQQFEPLSEREIFPHQEAFTKNQMSN